VEIYVFDRELRLLVLDAIERIEVAIRTRFAYELAHRHGAHAFMHPQYFKPLRRWENY
jgi:abortive infection bacteriophage resistance protein